MDGPDAQDGEGQGWPPYGPPVATGGRGWPHPPAPSPTFGEGVEALSADVEGLLATEDTESAEWGLRPVIATRAALGKAGRISL